MEGTYSVKMDGAEVGTVLVRRNGLYYDLTCLCSINVDGMTDLMMETEGGVQKIGLLLPIGGRLNLQKRIAIKQAEKGTCSFFLQPRGSHNHQFLPIDPDRPFTRLHLLRECRFAVSKGQIGVEWQQKNIGEKVENKS